MAFFCNFSPYIKKVFIIYFNLGVAFNSIAQAMDTIENIIEELSIEEKIAMCHAQSKFSSS